MSEEFARKLIHDHGKQAFHVTAELAAVAARRGDKQALAKLEGAAKVMIKRGMHKNRSKESSAR